ncbi:hypothetical protein SLA2020_130600 [Shorea laevis]
MGTMQISRPWPDEFLVGNRTCSDEEEQIMVTDNGCRRRFRRLCSETAYESSSGYGKRAFLGLRGAGELKFVIKTEYVNHPLFKVLLEEAETEYGFNSRGPLVLPCNVDSFCKVMLAIDDSGTVKDSPSKLGCGFPKGYGAYGLINPPRRITIKF